MSAIIPVVARAIPVVQQAVETDLTITEKILELIKSMNCNSACCGSEKVIITPLPDNSITNSSLTNFSQFPSSNASHHN